MPAPVVSVHVFVVAKDSAVEYDEPVFEKRICVTPLVASEAASVSVALVLLVAPAPPLITTLPAGAWLSTLTVTEEDTV